MYICLEDDGNVSCNKGWNYYIRNWELAKKCIKIMCQKYKLRGLIIGRKNCKLPDGCKEYITMKDKMSQDELINHYHKTNFLFLPLVCIVRHFSLGWADRCPNIRQLGWEHED